MVTTEVLSDYSSADKLQIQTIALLLCISALMLQQMALLLELGSKDWYSNSWNKWDISTYVLFGVALVLKLTAEASPTSQVALYAKFVMVVVLLLLFLRFFRFYYLQVNEVPTLA